MVPSPMNTARCQRPGAGANSAHSDSITPSPSTRRSPAAGPAISASFAQQDGHRGEADRQHHGPEAPMHFEDGPDRRAAHEPRDA